MSIDDEMAAHMDALAGTVAGSSGIISEIVTRLSSCFAHGGKLLICGNGGSAADAQHFAAEFVNHMRFQRPPLPAIALTTDTSVLTSISNDARYEDVFARQVQAIGCAGDILFALSTSGASANVLAALGAARRQGMLTVGFTGQAGVRDHGSRMRPPRGGILARLRKDLGVP